MTRPGVLVISHGSQNRIWVEQVEAAVAAMRAPGGVPVAASYLELVEGRLIQDGIDALERQGVTDIAAIPFFVSSGSTHLDEIAYAFGVKAEPLLPTDLVPYRVRGRVRLLRPIDDEPEIARILTEKLSGISVDPGREAVLLVGHGSDHAGFDEAWRRGLASLAGQVRSLGGFAASGWATLRPDLLAERAAALAAEHPGLRVLVSPVFLSEGYFTETVIPRRLAGLEVRYAGKTLLPHPLMTAWLERRAAEGLKSAADGQDG